MEDSGVSEMPNIKTDDDSPWGPCECAEDVDPDETWDGTHWKGCHKRPMEITKGEFVDACEAGAASAISAYQFCLDEGMTSEDAEECAVSEAGESGACYAGIGSCSGGGCKHG